MLTKLSLSIRLALLGLCSVSAFYPSEEPCSTYIDADLSQPVGDMTLHVECSKIQAYCNGDHHCLSGVQAGLYNDAFELGMLIKAGKVTLEKEAKQGIATLRGYDNNKVEIYFTPEKLTEMLASLEEMQNNKTTHCT